MGRLLIASIGAMTSFFTMVQLIALTLALTASPAQQASVGPPKTESGSTNTTKKNHRADSHKAVSHRSHPRRGHGPKTSHQEI